MNFGIIKEAIRALKKNRYKMIACDMDGTLLGSDLRVSDENNRAISELAKKRIPFVPCTGRTLGEMADVAKNPDIRYIIYSNGAGILDKETGERIKNGIPYEFKENLMEILSAFDFFPFLHADGNSYIDENLKGRYDEYKLNDTLIEIADTVALSFVDFKKTIMEKEVECLSLFFGDEEQFRKCREILMDNDKFVITSPWDLNIEIFYITAGKEKAVKILAEKLGIDIKDVISIGDSNNDAKALEVSGLGICVANGSDEVKKIADEIACSNDENVVEYVLKKYFQKSLTK